MNERERDKEVGEHMKEFMRARLEELLVMVLGAALIAATLEATPTAAEAAGYPGNPYPQGKSTYWAWQNRPDLPANLGEARDWSSNAALQGWPVSRYPRKGDIAVFSPGAYGADVTGHVAVVEQVLEDGSYATSQMDEADCIAGSAACGRVNRRNYPAAATTSFIHYKVDTRTTWSFAAGTAGWEARGLGEGASGGPGWYYPLAGSGPQLISPQLDIPLDSYNAVEIDMITGVPVTDPTVKVFFANAEQADFSMSRSVTLAGHADGQAHTYLAVFGNNVEWRGRLTRLRIDPAGSGSSGGVRIDRVRLLQVDTGSGTFNTLETPSSRRGENRL